MHRTIMLYYIPSNNHSCLGERVFITPLDERSGEVASAYTCTRCFDPLPYERGDIVVLPEGYDWESASQEFENSESFSLAGETAVRPRELTLVQRGRTAEEEE